MLISSRGSSDAAAVKYEGQALLFFTAEASERTFALETHNAAQQGLMLPLSDTSDERHMCLGVQGRNKASLR